MQINNKVIKVSTSDIIEVLHASSKTVIKTLSVVFRNNTETRNINIFVKENPSADSGAIIYGKSISKDGLYLTDLYLGPNNVLEIQCTDYTSGDEIDVVLQYIELS